MSIVQNTKVCKDLDVEGNFEEPQHSHRNSGRISKIRQALVANAQLVAIVVSVLLGLLIGILMHDAVQGSTDPPTNKVVMYMKFPGELFIRMLRLIIIPLTVSSIVVALAEIDTASAAKLGRRTFLYYFTTSAIATILGLVLMMVIKPGKGISEAEEESEPNQITPFDSFLDLLRNLIPPNLVEAALKSTQTKYAVKSSKFAPKNITIPTSAEDVANLLKDNLVVPWSSFEGKNVTIITDSMDYTYAGTVQKDGTNVLGLIVFSIALGVVLRKLGEDGRALLEFCKSWLHVVMVLVSWIMWVSPLGILSLIAGSLAEVEDLVKAFKDVGLLVAVNLTGYFIQSFIVYPLIYLFIVRKNPFVYLSGIVPAMITAFGTSSSAATLPVTIRCVTENNNVDRRVAQFCLPIGATINMDGSALYYAAVVLFMANLENITLNFGEFVLTALVAIFVSAGASGIPSAGLSYTVLCLEAVGLSTRFVGLLFPVVWIFDRGCTVNNVMGDAYGAGIINHMSSDLCQLPDDEEKGEVNDVDINRNLFHEENQRLTSDTTSV